VIGDGDEVRCEVLTRGLSECRLSAFRGIEFANLASLSLIPLLRPSPKHPSPPLSAKTQFDIDRRQHLQGGSAFISMRDKGTSRLDH
jgi:hypothetical protein